MRGIHHWVFCLAPVFILSAAPLAVVGEKTAGDQTDQGETVVEQEEATLADEVRALWEDKNLSDPDKLSAFRNLTEDRWLAFAGFVHLYAGRSYLDLFHWHKSQITEAMAELDSDADVSRLLTLAKEKLQSDAIQSTDAMLLAAMMNWDAAQPVLVELSHPNVAKDALVRPIHVHTLCLIAAARQSDEMIENLQPILRLTRDEEVREDILCAISAFNNVTAAGWTKGYIEANLNGELDEAMTTGLLILSKRLKPEAFQTYMADLIDSAKDPATVEQLKHYQADTSMLGVIPPPPNDVTWFYKGWDCFHFTQQKDGVLVRYGEQFEYHVQE